MEVMIVPTSHFDSIDHSFRSASGRHTGDSHYHEKEK